MLNVKFMSVVFQKNMSRVYWQKRFNSTKLVKIVSFILSYLYVKYFQCNKRKIISISANTIFIRVEITSQHLLNRSRVVNTQKVYFFQYHEQQQHTFRLPCFTDIFLFFRLYGTFCCFANLLVLFETCHKKYQHL